MEANEEWIISNPEPEKQSDWFWIKWEELNEHLIFEPLIQFWNIFPTIQQVRDQVQNNPKIF